MDRSQGGRANMTGNRLEQVIESCLMDCGYEKYPNKRELGLMAEAEKPVYCTQVTIGNNIYDTALKCDFLLFHPQKWPNGLVIEAKWQQVGGSVDEKYPFLVLSIRKSLFETILLLDGGGYRPGAEQWLRRQTDSKLLRVFNLTEFITWVNQGNL
ncbi:MAG: hypothetical protein OXE52_05550 [Chloroflexi bacterium]|nr:hypothetical protein [Chloroflexota bacterium]